MQVVRQHVLDYGLSAQLVGSYKLGGNASSSRRPSYLLTYIQHADRVVSYKAVEFLESIGQMGTKQRRDFGIIKAEECDAS